MKRPDWDAIERDYRTGQFTLRELEAKHGVDNATIARKKKRNAWVQDLSAAVRQATNAKLIEAHVSKQISKGQQSISTAVLSAAEIGKQIIVGHRDRLASLAKDVEVAQQAVMRLAPEANDLRQALVLTQAVANVASTTKTLIEQERKAFNLDETDEGRGRELSEQLTDFLGALHQQGAGRLKFTPKIVGGTKAA